MPNVACQQPPIILDAGRLIVDLSKPRTLIVHGVNPETGEYKDYLLRVTQFGKLVLQ